MKRIRSPITISGTDGPIRIARNNHGIPDIHAQSMVDLMYGLGWIHANDRQLQTLLTRTLINGQAAEHLKPDESLIQLDIYMRRMNFLPDPKVQAELLTPYTRQVMVAYTNGFNDWMDENGPVFEFKLFGHRKPAPYTIADCLRLAKVFGFLGLADIQAQMEKFIVEMIQNGVDEAKIRALFPHLKDPIDRGLLSRVRVKPPLVPDAAAWLDRLPRASASNNWAVAGRHTASGFPLLCNDPHLEVNRLPNVWQEVVLRLPEETLIGASVPGIPGIVIGRNRHIVWSATYSFMDMLDYRIERCRDGRYYREDGWKPFRVREETIRVKKRKPIQITVYENENGLLEGDPFETGDYLVLGWSAASGCGAGDLEALIQMMTTRTVADAMALYRRVEAVAMNWVFADTRGDIGYQMSGRHFRRPDGVSGLLPRPGWDAACDPDGFNDPDELPQILNPPEGIIVTANQDLNHLGQSNPINLSMGPYRADRIVHLLESCDRLDVSYMKDMHYDLYSLQAERLMRVLAPLLPDTENGRTLKTWDLHYHADSIGAMLFESVYRAMLDVVFGDHGLGREVIAHLFSETSLFNDYYAHFDRILETSASVWFDGTARNTLLRKAIDEGLAVQARPYGETRQIKLAHLLFGERLPRWLGFDAGPIILPGSRATIPQGQIFKSGGRLTTFSPTYRFIADLATDELHTNLAGGPSDRRFSKWYLSDLRNWYEGNYKVLK